MRILFLSSWFPYPPVNGSQQRVFNLLRALSRSHEVTLLSFADPPGVVPAAPALTRVCRAVEVVPATPFQPQGWAARIGHLRALPRSVLATYSAEMARRVDTLCGAKHFDLVIASQLPAASYIRCCAGLPALFEEVELGVLYERFARAPTLLQRSRYALTWSKHRRYLGRLLRSFRACTVVSEREQQLLANAVSQHPPATVIPNGVNLADYADVHATPQPNHLVFAGSFRYGANHDAMNWFVRDVLPLIHARIPDVHLTITGDTADRQLPPGPHVVCTGHLDDVRPVIASSWVSLAPMRIGGGTRLKILESMALGTPVVATSKGAEGLEVIDDAHLLIADAPAQFAERVVRLLRDTDLRRRLSLRARALVAGHYDWNLIGPRFVQLVADIASEP